MFHLHRHSPSSLWLMVLVLLLLFFMGPGVVRPVQGDPGRKVVAFAQDTMANDWRVAQVRDVEQTLSQYPWIDFLFSNAQGQTARQVMDIENYIAQGVDLLITSPRDMNLVSPVIAMAYQRGIPVVLLSRRTNHDHFTTFLHADNRAIAAMAARRLASRLKGQGRILVLQHIPTSTPGMLRTEGFLKELANHPGLEVAAIKRADSMRGKAIKAVEAALAEGIKFDAIYAQSDSMATGARMALKTAGIDPKTIPITGIDYIREARDAIRQGEMDASFTYPTFGVQGAHFAAQILQGKTVPKEVVVDSTMITRENVEQVKPIF
ncbi:substrate-binding domain-containing protein [Magnetococcus sp. PR-3]|uniref:substrate-binding domain-containing protein n=1 Tax=Magnetococcus sp. PR-3 TaxID=3120355 RepID=UPI002FCDE474